MLKWEFRTDGVYISCSQQTLEYSEFKRIKVVELYGVKYWKLFAQFQFTNTIYKNDYIDEAPTILNLLLLELHGVDIIFFFSNIFFLPIRVDVLITNKCMTTEVAIEYRILFTCILYRTKAVVICII